MLADYRKLVGNVSTEGTPLHPRTELALVTDRYKYVANAGQKDELYDLETDPYELANLIDDPDKAEILADMKGRLATWRSKTKDPESL